MKNKLLIITRDQDIYLQRVRSMQLSDLEILAPTSPDELSLHMRDANIAFGNPNLLKNYIHLAQNLDWVQSCFAGVDALVSEGMPNGYRLTNVKDTYGLPMAEYVFSYLLMFERKLLENRQWQKESKWNQQPYPVLAQKTLAILGTGSIGKEIARVAQAFGMKVKGLRIKNESVEYFDQIYSYPRIKDFLKQSDYVVSVLPHTERTAEVIDKKFLEMMDSSSILMNIGRGSAVKDSDLIAALNAKQIRAAVLDVFQEEPLSPKSPYWRMKNVFVTPHVSGYVTHDKLFEIFAENYKRFTEERDLIYSIDFQKGY